MSVSGVEGPHAESRPQVSKSLEYFLTELDRVRTWVGPAAQFSSGEGERSPRSVNLPFMAAAAVRAVMVVNFDIAQTSKSKISLVIFSLQVRPFETSWALSDVRVAALRDRQCDPTLSRMARMIRMSFV